MSAENSLGNHGLIALVNRLRSSGAHLTIDLPTIVLCGQQSSGKSSVSEAISGVPLPRNHGTCTRCPTEVRLIHAETDWKCTIKIRWEWDDINRRFCNNVREEEVGIVHSPIEVVPLVTLAQRSLLSKSGVKFSRNVVCVEVESRECVDLTIVDLPGLIQAVEDESDSRYIDLVRFLVEDYIRRPNTLIAAVISCNNDMENQLINHLIRKYDINGNRTLGILTKVDIIEPELESQWINILLGKKYPLRLGYIAVRNLSTQELRSMHNTIDCFKKARDIESNFFMSHSTWSQLDNNIQNRLGSENLIILLSKQLSYLISQQLPRIRMTILNEMNELKSQLSELPEPPKLQGFENGKFIQRRHTDVKETLVDLILQFTDSCKTLVRISNGKLWQQIMKEYKQFFTQLEKYQPQFVISENSKRKKGKENAFTIQDVILECLSCTGRELHFTVSDSARKKFLTHSMKPWGMCAHQLVLSISSILASIVGMSVKRHFIHFKNLHIDALKACENLISDLQTTTLHEVMQLMDREREQDEFTLSTHRLLGTYDRVKYQFEKAFPSNNIIMSNNNNNISSSSSTSSSSSQNYNNNNYNNKIPTLSDTEESKKEQAITVMAQCVAYYDLSYRRFSDNVAMAVNSLLVNKFSKRIESSMFKSINILNGSTQELCKLLQEDPTITQRRNQIQTRIQKLSIFMDELARLIPDTPDDTNEFDDNNNCNNNNNENNNNLNLSASQSTSECLNKQSKNNLLDSNNHNNNNGDYEEDEDDDDEDGFDDAAKALKVHDRNTNGKLKFGKKTKKKRKWKIFQ